VLPVRSSLNNYAFDLSTKASFEGASADMTSTPAAVCRKAAGRSLESVQAGSLDMVWASLGPRLVFGARHSFAFR